MDLNFLVFVLVGFLAQMIDGALGMAYGVSSNTFLLSIGVPPAAASASVHMAEVVTTGVSGFSHWRMENLDKDLIKRLIIPGVLGGVTGAYILTSVSGDFIKPIVSAYLLIMGRGDLVQGHAPRRYHQGNSCVHRRPGFGRRLFRCDRRRRLGTNRHHDLDRPRQPPALHDWLGQFLGIFCHIRRIGDLFPGAADGLFYRFVEDHPGLTDRRRHRCAAGRGGRKETTRPHFNGAGRYIDHSSEHPHNYPGAGIAFRPI